MLTFKRIKLTTHTLNDISVWFGSSCRSLFDSASVTLKGPIWCIFNC